MYLNWVDEKTDKNITGLTLTLDVFKLLSPYYSLVTKIGLTLTLDVFKLIYHLIFIFTKCRLTLTLDVFKL